MRFKLKIAFIVVSGLFLFQEAKAQKDTLIYYLKNTGDIVVKENADYFMMIMPQDANSKVYPMLQYYMNGGRKLISATVSRNDLAYQGLTTNFFSNGKEKSSVIYKNGMPIGKATEYYPNGKIYNIKEYKKNGDQLFIECRDSTGTILTEKGIGKWLTYNEDFKTLIKEETVKNGVIQTDWPAMFDIKPATVSLSADSLELNSLYRDSVMNNLALYNRNIDAEIQYISSRIKYPPTDRANKSSGVVIILFIVEVDGKLSNLKILKSVSKTIDEEALRVLKLSSPWKPKKIDGKPVRAGGTIPIRFSLL